MCKKAQKKDFYTQKYEQRINDLKDQGRYRTFIPIMRKARSYPKGSAIKDKKNLRNVTIWCSNDYLGMAQNEQVL